MRTITREELQGAMELSFAIQREVFPWRGERFDIELISHMLTWMFLEDFNTDAVRRRLMESPEYADHHQEPPVVELARVEPAGRVFKRNGETWRWKGVSAFALLDKFQKGEDITEFMGLFKSMGYNVLRVFPYVPVADWKEKAWGTPPVDTIRKFVAKCAEYGFYVELVLLTDDEPLRLSQAHYLIGELKDIPTLFFEAGNEPRTHKNIKTSDLREALAGTNHSSGDYERNGEKWFGNYFTIHTSRDSDWPRKTHDMMEQWNGNGPDLPPLRKIQVPMVADEPIRPDSADYAERDYYAYAASASLFGAGATFHYEGGKFGRIPSTDERRCASYFAAGLNVFPVDAPGGAYSRPSDSTLRTYIIGNYMVRVRPTSMLPPFGGWQPLDEMGIAWKR